MALDPANYLSELDPTQPPFNDPGGQADDQIRAIKNAIRGTFAGGDWDDALATTATIAILEGLASRIAALEAISVPTLYAPVFGSLTILSGTTANQAVTGVGFQPAVVLVVAVRVTSGGMNISVGVADGTNEHIVWAAADGGVGVDDRGFDNELWKVYRHVSGPTATAGAVGSLASLDADGFTLNPAFTDFDIELFWIAFK